MLNAFWTFTLFHFAGAAVIEHSGAKVMDTEMIWK